tara:strand:- start:212 stop:790 length:579 start_codon:yes stop_codon:yes gene_type:complete
MLNNKSFYKRINREIEKNHNILQNKLNSDYNIYLYNDDYNFKTTNYILNIYKNNNIHDSILELYVPNDYPFKPYRVKQAVINEKIIQNYLKYLSNLSVGIKKYNKDILYYYVLIYNKIKPQILSAECMCCESITCSTKWSPSRTFIDFIDEYIEILGINIVLKYNIENIWNKTRLSILNEDVLNIILNYCIE